MACAAAASRVGVASTRQRRLSAGSRILACMQIYFIAMASIEGWSASHILLSCTAVLWSLVTFV